MPKCAVKKRKNYTLKVQKKDGVSYFRFPQNDIRREKWRNIIARANGDEFFKPHDSSVICSEHFNKEDVNITKKGFNKLTRIALPNIQYEESITTLIENVSSASTSANPTNTVQNLPICKSINGSYVCTTLPSTSQHQLTVPSSTSLAIGQLPEAEVIVANVYQYLESEFVHLKSLTFNSADLTPLGNILQRTAEATGVTQETVTAILVKRKLSSDLKADACLNKRAKLSQDFEDEDVSTAEEEKSSDEEDSADEDGQNEQEEGLVETLKVEIEEEDEVPRDAGGRKLWLVVEPLPTQPSAPVQEPLPPASTTPTAVVVKQEPIEDEDPLTTSAVPLLQSSNHIPKSEPIDDDDQHMEHELSSTTQEERENRPD